MIQTSDLADKGNFGINKSFPSLPDSPLCSMVRRIDTNLLKVFPLEFKPSFSNFITYRVYSQCFRVSPFEDIILVHGKEFVVRPAILEKVF